MREYSRARPALPTVPHAIRERGQQVFAYIRKYCGIGLAALCLAGCAATEPPTQAQIDRALTFARAHSGLPEAPTPRVHLASSHWMGTQVGITDSGRVRGLYLFSCRCIYLDEQSWTMPILVHEMVHYLEHMAGMPAGHKRADPIGDLYASTVE
jgi:hypothetical protein